MKMLKLPLGILAFTSILALQLDGRTTSAPGEVIQVTLTAPPPVVRATGNGCRISVVGFVNSAAPGQPRLPSQLYRVAVPPDIDWSTLKIRSVSGQPQPLALPGPIAPAAPDSVGAPGGGSAGYPAGRTIVDSRDPAVYGRAALYPEAPVKLRPPGQMRKWRFTKLRFSPVQWNPATGEAQFWPELQVELEFERLATNANAAPAADDPLLADDKMDNLAKTLLANYDQAAAWYAPSETAQAAARKKATADYVIITTTTITNNCPRLHDFVAHKSALGYHVAVVTESAFNSLTGQYPNQRADKIRQWLMTHYAAWGIVNVLLIGNPSPYESGEGDIPMKLTWPRWYEADNRESPTDMYYSDLTSNWDNNGNGGFGGPTDIDSGAIDLTPEVYVGRIPVYANNYQHLADILQKIMDYDNEVDIGWRKSILLPMSFSAEGYDGAALSEMMWNVYLAAQGFGRCRVYQQGNGPCGAASASGWGGDHDLRGDDVVRNLWAANDYGVVCWWAHGNYNCASVGFDPCWDGYLFQSYQTVYLDDEHPAFTYQCSCLNGYPESSDNLQYRILRQGGIATVGATRDSYFNTDYGYGDFNGAAVNAGIGYEYVLRIGLGHEAGEALAQAKLAVTPDVGDNYNYWMNQFDFNLYGDPSTRLNRVVEYFPLDGGRSWRMTAVPRRFKYFGYVGSWSGVAIRPTTQDHNLMGDTHQDLASPYAISAAPGVTPDFVVANGHKMGSDTHYAQVSIGNNTPYWIQAFSNGETLPVGDWFTAYFRTNDLFQIVQLPVEAGRSYYVLAQVSYGSPDLMLFAFDPGRQAGSRTDCDAMANDRGAGGAEFFTYTATHSGYLGIIVLQGNGAGGMYNLRVQDVTPMDAPASCSASDGTATNRISVTWSAVTGATHYRVYRSRITDHGSAVPVSDWTTLTSYNDWAVEAGPAYEYWVQAAADDNGYRAGDYSPGDSGYVTPPTLFSGAKVILTNTPSYYQFAPPSAYWAAVGVRQENSADDWNMRLYSAPDFVSQLAVSARVVPVDFVVLDRHHLASGYRGIEAYRVTGTGPAALEFDGGAEVLSIGTTTNLSWLAGEVVKMRDLNLTSATYRVTLKLTSGTADLDVGLFGSGDGDYTRSREQYLARSTLRAGQTEVFYVTITNTDWYGLCMWANDTNSAVYSLEVVPTVAGLWEGDVSDDWHTAGNWNDNAVPASNDDVNIPARTRYSPRIYRQIARCNHLTVQPYATLTINTNELYAAGNAHIHGFLNLDSTRARFHLGGDLYWEKGSTATMIASSRILVTGDWNFEEGANVQLTSGYVEFEGDGSSFIRCYDDNCNLYNVVCSKYSPDYLGVSAVAVSDLPIHNLYLYDGTVFRHYSSHNLILRGFFNNMGGTFQWPYGGAVFTGDPSPAALKPTADSHFNHLVLSGTKPLVLSDTYTNYLRVNGHLTIRSNTLDSAGLELQVSGNWTNEVGRSGFLCRTGTVTFTGNSSQYVCGSNVFYTVRDERGSRGMLYLHDDIVVSNAHHVATSHGVRGRLDVEGLLDLYARDASLVVYARAAVTTARLDQGGHLSMYGGSLQADDLVDNGLFGRYTIDDGTVTLRQSALQRVHLNAIVELTGGALRVIGATGYSDWPSSANASLTMSGGTLDFDCPGIRVNYSSLYHLTNNITGGRIRTSGDFLVPDTAFNPPGGELEFYGTDSQTLDVASGSSLHNLAVNKTAGVVTATSNLALTGDFALKAGSFTAPSLMLVAGDWANYVGTKAFAEGAGTVVFNGSSASSLLTGETFNILQLVKSYSDVDALQLTPGTQVNVSSNLTCADGVLAMGAGSVLNVGGNLTLYRGAGLNARAEDTAIFVGGTWINQNTNHTAYKGFEPGLSSRVTFDGTRSTTLATDCPFEEFFHLVVNRPGGAFRPVDSIYVNGQLSISNGTWSSSVNGLQHHLQGDVYVHTTGAWGDLSPSNMVWFSGGTDATLTYAGTNGYFPNIGVDKSGGARVRLLSDLSQSGTIGLNVAQGTYQLNGHADRLTAGVSVGSNGVLVVDAGARLELGKTSTLAVQAGGRLEVIGAAGNPAVVSHQAGNYTVQVRSNATIAARQAVFEYLNTDGVYVMDGAVVDPAGTFDDCVFRNGVAGGALLRLDNNQSFTALRTAFDSNAGGGAANVRKSLDQGQVTFRDATGVFAGEAYDNDPFNRIDWSIGLLSSLVLEMPGYVTLGGQYEARATVGPTNACEPIHYFWNITDLPAVQHAGGANADKTKVTWTTSGKKSIQVMASNQWGAVTATGAVTVQALRIAEVQRPVPGSNLVRLVIEGTTPASKYEIQYTPNLGEVPWTRVQPHGVGLVGSETNTTWFDYSTAQRPLETFSNLFYRAKVLPPDAISETSKP